MISYAIYVMKESWTEYHGHSLKYLLDEGVVPELYMYDRRDQGTVDLDKITDGYLMDHIINPWVAHEGLLFKQGIVITYTVDGVTRCKYVEQNRLMEIHDFFQSGDCLLSMRSHGIHIVGRADKGSWSPVVSLIIDKKSYFIVKHDVNPIGEMNVVINGQLFPLLDVSNDFFNDKMIKSIRDRVKEIDGVYERVGLYQSVLKNTKKGTTRQREYPEGSLMQRLHAKKNK